MDWSYIAGFFDGEGCVSFRAHGRPSIRVTMVQKEEAVLKEIALFLKAQGVSGVRIYLRKGYNREYEKWIYWYALVIGPQYDIRSFLRSMLPLVIVKRQKTKDALGFLAQRLPSD